MRFKYVSAIYEYEFVHRKSGQSVRGHDEGRVPRDRAAGGRARAVPRHHAQLHQGDTGGVHLVRRVRVRQPLARRQHDVSPPRGAPSPARRAPRPDITFYLKHISKSCI